MAGNTQIDLTLDDLRAVAGYAALCASSVLPIFEQLRPTDMRPHNAIEATQLFAGGAKRTKLLRDNAWAALRAASEAARFGEIAASEAARAAVAAAGFTLWQKRPKSNTFSVRLLTQYEQSNSHARMK